MDLSGFSGWIPRRTRGALECGAWAPLYHRGNVFPR